MLFTRVSTTERRSLIRVIAADASVGARIKRALEAGQHYHVEVVSEPLDSPAVTQQKTVLASLLLVTLEQGNPRELAQLETLLQSKWAPRRVIVISDGLAEVSARWLLKLQVSDWLPQSCSDAELVAACKQVMESTTTKADSIAKHARCVAFMPAIGGAGATTLALAAASALTGKGRPDLSGCCIIDLNFQNGSLADYLDVQPNLRLTEVYQDPRRLDANLRRNGFRGMCR